MRFSNRLRAMARLGQATLRVAERSFLRRVASEDTEREARLGNIEGQTSRAQAFAARLEGSERIVVTDSKTVRPHRWPFISQPSSARTPE